MKKTSGKNRETILLYRFRGTDIGQRVYTIAARMGILCRVVEEDQTEESIGSLLKIPGLADLNSALTELFGNTKTAADGESSEETAQEKLPLERQMMVMYGLSSQRLNLFLQNMKKAGIPRIALKAIVTPHNVSWSFRELYRELEREEAAVKAQAVELQAKEADQTEN